jgi:glycosyltransferase involved in cell wall biosynthesis
MTAVVQINSGDLIGRRFNGYDLTPYLQRLGIQSTHLVFWNRQSDASFVHQMFPYPGSMRLTRALNQLEGRISTHARFHPQSWFLPAHKTFRAADVAHYHIVHDGYFSLGAMKFLSWLKPTIWTWHDPWPLTGHCIYPMQCDRWAIGCGYCPDLNRPFPMRRDRTAEEFERKKRIYRRTSADIIVASPWMLNLAVKSPLANEFRFHLIPFGIDLTKFRERDRASAQRRLGVLPNRKVIMLRAVAGPYKGLTNLIDALSQWGVGESICIIALQETGHFDRFIGTHQVIEFNWSNDEDFLIDAYSASDVFMMPSKAEAFGMMAIEAMACSRPVISFEGTSLPSITFAPEAGLAVRLDDNEALAAAIRHLLSHSPECELRGRRSRALAEEHYDITRQAKALASLYRDVQSRGSGASLKSSGDLVSE